MISESSWIANNVDVVVVVSWKSFKYRMEFKSEHYVDCVSCLCMRWTWCWIWCCKEESCTAGFLLSHWFQDEVQNIGLRFSSFHRLSCTSCSWIKHPVNVLPTFLPSSPALPRQSLVNLKCNLRTNMVRSLSDCRRISSAQWKPTLIYVSIALAPSQLPPNHPPVMAIAAAEAAALEEEEE